MPRLRGRAAVIVGRDRARRRRRASRVYLRVHYLSDVVGGWGLAAALFSVCGIVALVVAFVRNNEGATA